MNTIHEQRAIEAATAAALPVQISARQGDVVLQRTGEALTRGAATPPHGITVIAGAHGEHRIIAEEYSADASGEMLRVDLPRGGRLVHTDVPAARHAALQLAPGRWTVQRSQELDLDGCIRPSQD